MLLVIKFEWSNLFSFLFSLCSMLDLLFIQSSLLHANWTSMSLLAPQGGMILHDPAIEVVFLVCGSRFFITVWFVTSVEVVRVLAEQNGRLLYASASHGIGVVELLGDPSLPGMLFAVCWPLTLGLVSEAGWTYSIWLSQSVGLLVLQFSLLDRLKLWFLLLSTTEVTTTDHAFLLICLALFDTLLVGFWLD
jgi:hypothetical protein